MNETKESESKVDERARERNKKTVGTTWKDIGDRAAST